MCAAEPMICSGARLKGNNVHFQFCIQGDKKITYGIQ